jgi:pyruvate/2-oxoglutarate dehydrogenase complex dihydrolipoamide dehydrogenase (E3) component
MQRKEFDKNMVSRVEKNMKKTGVKFLYATNPLKLEKSDKNGRIKVTYKYIDIENSEDFDTVIFAIGR